MWCAADCSRHGTPAVGWSRTSHEGWQAGQEWRPFKRRRRTNGSTGALAAELTALSRGRRAGPVMQDVVHLRSSSPVRAVTRRSPRYTLVMRDDLRHNIDAHHQFVTSSGERTAASADSHSPKAVRRFGAVAVGARASGAMAVGALSIGALAVGAVAIGALAIGRLTVKRLAVKRSRIGRLEIDELVVRRLQVEALVVPTRDDVPGDDDDRG